LLVAVVLTGAADRPRVTLMTALPLVWGEGSVSDVLTGRTGRSETLKMLDKQINVRAIDTLSRATLGRDVAIIAQPRRLTPQELVALDKWVRGGGRAMIFADPELLWPSAYAPGDTRRAPPVTLLDPLLKHWGVALDDSDHREQTVRRDGATVVLLAAGKWTGPKSCSGSGSHVLDCRIGKGRVVLVGDADFLDARLWQSRHADNPTWLVDQILELGAANQSDSTRLSGKAVAALAIAATAVLASAYRYFRGT
jgi:ABC-type uncharacterized transport system